jgi:carboxymethylenebutenolidase
LQALALWDATGQTGTQLKEIVMKKIASLVLVSLLLVPGLAWAQGTKGMNITSADISILSDGKEYKSYMATPSTGGPYPGIVLIHSFNGLEDGYKTMTDQFAAEGFVVLAIGWQTFEKSPSDATVDQLIRDSVTYLGTRNDVDTERLGLTGFCAGGRYTMLFLPQIDSFKVGVAWYGFPYSGETQPADVIDQLSAPLLIIHGTADTASPIAGIYQYATALTAAGKYFELKVYYGAPHGFMITNGQLSQGDIPQDAFNEMVSFFRRKLGEP